MYKKLFSSLALLLSVNFLFGQSNESDSTSYYVSRLKTNSILVATTYVPKIVLDQYSQKLVNSKDRKLNLKLCESLVDTTKLLPIHVILSKRFYPSSSLSENFKYVGDSVVGIYYIFNKLKWYVDGTGKISLDLNDMKNCQNFWDKMLCDKFKKNKKM